MWIQQLYPAPDFQSKLFGLALLSIHCELEIACMRDEKKNLKIDPQQSPPPPQKLLWIRHWPVIQSSTKCMFRIVNNQIEKYFYFYFIKNNHNHTLPRPSHTQTINLACSLSLCGQVIMYYSKFITRSLSLHRITTIWKILNQL